MPSLAACRCLFRLMKHCFLGRWICLPVSERFPLMWKFIKLLIINRGCLLSISRHINPYGFFNAKSSLCIYNHIQTDCFIVSQLFSIARHVWRLKLGSKPAQLYVRHSIKPLGQQANYISSVIIRLYFYTTQSSSFTSMQLNGFKYSNLTLIIQSNINHLFTYS